MPSVSPVAKSTGSDPLMWITADRVFYFGLLGSPTVRQMGSVLVYVSVAFGWTVVNGSELKWRLCHPMYRIRSCRNHAWSM